MLGMKFVPFWLTPETGLVLEGGERRELVLPRSVLKITGFSFAPDSAFSIVVESLSIGGREQLATREPVALVALAGGSLALDTLTSEGALSYLRILNIAQDPIHFMLRALAYEPD